MLHQHPTIFCHHDLALCNNYIHNKHDSWKLTNMVCGCFWCPIPHDLKSPTKQWKHYALNGCSRLISPLGGVFNLVQRILFETDHLSSVINANKQLMWTQPSPLAYGLGPKLGHPINLWKQINLLGYQWNWVCICWDTPMLCFSALSVDISSEKMMKCLRRPACGGRCLRELLGASQTFVVNGLCSEKDRNNFRILQKNKQNGYTCATFALLEPLYCLQVWGEDTPPISGL